MARTLAVLLALALPGLSAAAAAKVRVAVMDIQPVQGVQAGTAAVLTNVAADDIARGGFDVVSKTDIVNLIGFEKQKTMLGCSDASCLAEIGGALGVDYMFTGQVGQIGSQYHLSLQWVDVRKARIAARGSRYAERNEDALLRATREATAATLAAIRPGAAPGGQVPTDQAVTAPRSHRAAWIAFGTAGALLAGGAVTGYVAKAKYDALADKEGDPGFAADYADEESGIRTLTVTADVLYGGAVVAAGIGTWLWFRADAPVTVSPIVTPSSAGVALAGRF